jgi:nitrogen fixation-related uncharacterized protein
VNGTDRLRTAIPLVRAGLVVFVLAWLFGPYELRAAVPLWLPFVVALGLELQFFLGWPGAAGAVRERPDRGPQAVDRELYGYEADELLLIRDAEGELWIPWSGETGEEFSELVEEARERRERVLSEPPAPRVEPERGARLRRLLVGLGLIAALVAFVWAVDRGGWEDLDPDTRAEAEERFSEEASRIAGHDVTIRCDESGDFVGAIQHAEGVAEVGGRLAYLTPERCHDLYRLAFEEEVTFSQTARSLAVLAHEAWHLRGVRDEGTTECYALQSGVELGQRLGLSEGTARRMMRQQLAENQLRGGTTVEYRLPAECRDGGRLDLRPRDSSFP